MQFTGVVASNSSCKTTALLSDVTMSYCVTDA